MKRKLHLISVTTTLLCAMAILLFYTGCQRKTNQVTISEPSSDINVIKPDSTRTLEASSTTELQWHDSTIVEFKRWKTKFNAERLPNIEKEKIGFTATTTLIDSSKIEKKQVSDSKFTTLTIPAVGYLVTKTDTLYAPEKVLATIPKAIPIKMGIKSDAERNIQFMDIEHELTAQYIWQTLFDSRGYLWLASYGGGLISYDGNSIRTFTETQGLSSSFINFIIEDRQQNLWMGTDGDGLIKYDGTHFYYYNEKQGLNERQKDVNTGMEDQFGNLWFGTDDGLIKFPAKNAQKNLGGEQEIVFSQSLLGKGINVITKIVKGNNNAIWLGTPKGIIQLKPDQYIHYKTNTDDIRDIYKSSDGNLWITFRTTGFARFDGVQFEHFTDGENPTYNRIQSIYEGTNKKIYIGTENQGLLIYDGEHFENLTEENGLASKWIMDINEDNKGNFWISTWFDGIFKYGTLQLEHLPKKKSHISSNIVSIDEDNQGRIWLGSIDNGIYSVRDDGYYHIKLNNSNLQNTISTMTLEESGALWIGAANHGTVSRLYEGEAIHYDLISDSSTMIIDAVVDSKGILWLSDFNNGIIRFDGTDFRRLTPENGLLDDSIYQIVEQANGDIYFLSFYGVSILSNNTLKSFKIGEHYISCALADSSDNIWFGTNEGPIKLEAGDDKDHIRYTSYSSEKNPSDNFINTINESANGELWLGTDTKGMIVLTPNENTAETAEYEIESIDRQDGFIGTGVLFSSGFIDSKEKLWVGTKKGVTKIDLKKNKISKDPIQLYLTDIDINTMPIQNYVDTGSNQNLTVSDSTVPFLTPFFNIAEKLELAYDSNHLTFTFGALEWQSPHAINYQFKLSGLDAGWSEITKTNTTDYRNLSYGDYVFMVRAVSKSGVWSDTVTYDFTIKPPWWHTWWARISYALFALLLIGSLIKYRISRAQKHIEATYHRKLATQEALEEGRQMEKERIAMELHDGVLGSLFGIRLGLDAFKNDSEVLSEQTPKYVKKLFDLEKDIRRLSHGLSYSDIFSHNPFVKVVEDLIIAQNTSQSITFNYYNDINIPWGEISDKIKYNLYRIIQESLRNIVKHSKAKQVQVSFEKEKNQILLKITDDGIGLHLNRSKKGIGFKNIETRTKAIKGEVKFENQEKGLLVQVRFDH